MSISNARSVPINEQNGGIHQHPRNLEKGDLHLSARVSVVLRAADDAVLQGKISAMNAGILTMVVSDGLSVTEISDKIGISTNAVYQQLQRLKIELPRFIIKREPFD